MSADTAYLALLLDAPLQSWGFASRFQRRTTGLHPTKSGVVGLICAAMGLAKDSQQESKILRELANLKMTSIVIPRRRQSNWKAAAEELPVRRMEDFHTVGGGYDKNIQPQFIPRKASGGPCDDPTVTRRQYLLDARFGVILTGNRLLLQRVATDLVDPVWGIWFGRKSCIPAEPICRGLFASSAEAEKALIGDAPLESFTTVTEVEDFDNGTDSLNDQPVSFGDGTSSGPDKRQFAVRRIRVQSGAGLSAKE
jgi:CRISPR system Cascade subunit CasD